MKRERRTVLVVFDTIHGQCATIARRIAERIRERGHDAYVEQAPGARPLSLDDFAAVIVVAPVYNRRHPPNIERFVCTHAHGLRDRPTAFISVSLGAAARLRFVRAGIRAVSERLFAVTRWRPDHVLHAGGSIDYPVYGPVVRRGMQTAALVFGLPRDTTRRHELTQWDAVFAVADAVVDDLDDLDDRREDAAFTFA